MTLTTFRHLVWLLCLLTLCGIQAFLGGCTGLASLADTLNTREVASCVWFSGSAGPYAQVLGVTATGGTPLATCLDARRP